MNGNPCAKCVFWRPMDPSSSTSAWYCCHYLLDTGQRRGPDPCARFVMRVPKIKGKNRKKTEDNHDEAR